MRWLIIAIATLATAPGSAQERSSFQATAFVVARCTPHRLENNEIKVECSKGVHFKIVRRMDVDADGVRREFLIIRF